VDEAKLTSSKKDVVGADETGFNQGNIDGGKLSLGYGLQQHH